MTDKDGLVGKRWERMREFILARDQYLDQEAKRYGKRVEAQVVHHIFPREFFPQYAFDEWNLISLSNKTHDEMHDRTSHLLTMKGFELMLRTARKEKIQIEDAWKNIVSKKNKSYPPRSQRSKFRL